MTTAQRKEAGHMPATVRHLGCLAFFDLKAQGMAKKES
jgi:hypothetical protein